MDDSLNSLRAVRRILLALEQGEPANGDTAEHAQVLEHELATGHEAPGQGVILGELTSHGQTVLEILRDESLLTRLSFLASRLSRKLNLTNLTRMHKLFLVITQPIPPPEAPPEAPWRSTAFSLLETARKAEALNRALQDALCNDD